VTLPYALHAHLTHDTRVRCGSYLCAVGSAFISVLVCVADVFAMRVLVPRVITRTFTHTRAGVVVNRAAADRGDIGNSAAAATTAWRRACTLAHPPLAICTLRCASLALYPGRGTLLPVFAFHISITAHGRIVLRRIASAALFFCGHNACYLRYLCRTSLFDARRVLRCGFVASRAPCFFINAGMRYLTVRRPHVRDR